MAGTHRRGYTLVELLVVVLIITVLAGLLLAALSAVRGSARKAQCTANLRQVGLNLEKFTAIYDGLTPGTIPDVLNGAPPPSVVTGGRWVDLSGNLDKPNMNGWDGYTGFVYEQYSDEVRRMWSCTETITPYVGNVAVLGRQVPNPKFRRANSGTYLTKAVLQMPLPLSDIPLVSIVNRSKAIIAYDGGLGLAGAGGLAADATAEVTDFDDGGYPGLTPTAWGYFWYSAAAGPLEGPHQRTHNVLKADFSVGTLQQPADPLNPAVGSDIVTDPMDMSQFGREFTRFPKRLQ